MPMGRVRATVLPIVQYARRLVVLFVLLWAVTSCGKRKPTASPEAAVRELVDRMQQVQGHEGDARAVYELLSSRARANLSGRARRYSDASGKTIAPDAMLVPSRFTFRFLPQRYSAQVSGPQARVLVLGAASDEHAEVGCVFEEGGWRVDLALPPLPPIQKRANVTN